MKQTFMNGFRVVGIAVVVAAVCAMFAYAAWTGPTATAPGNNVQGPINTSLTPQSKGGTTVPAGSLLDIASTFSSAALYVVNNMTVTDEVVVSTLPLTQSGWTTGLRPVCTDSTNKLVICTPQCRNGFVEQGEQCDDGNNNNNDSCSNSCTGSNPPSGGGAMVYYACFIADTQVSMADGSKKNIEDVQIGDVVKGETSNNTVLAFHRPPKSEGVIYGFNGDKPFVTAEHPFKTTKGWKSINPDKTRQEHIGIEVTKLEVGDEILTETGNTLVSSIESELVSETTPLYNFVLSGDRTYYADGYLVHNKQPCEATATCVDYDTHLLTVPGDPQGDVLPLTCSVVGTIWQQNNGQNPAPFPGCGSGAYWYKGCYQGPVNGQPGAIACGNVAP